MKIKKTAGWIGLRFCSNMRGFQIPYADGENFVLNFLKIHHFLLKSLMEVGWGLNLERCNKNPREMVASSSAEQGEKSIDGGDSITIDSDLNMENNPIIQGSKKIIANIKKHHLDEAALSQINRLQMGEVQVDSSSSKNLIKAGTGIQAR
ncbi:conserved hypothetical protein [Ricinus communis]|uniref:Uncharacterized protein n=1 Tax=Ricinus communis TaxID=3988 RepID=B9SFM0_RICCO|nr:conserved hypothetical protein [Ricinus communis]